MYPDSPHARYQRDASFRTLVDLLESLVHQARYSPSELREASLLACIHYGRIAICSRVIYVDSAGVACA